MGYYRLLLAVMVLFSHCGLKLPNYNQGVTAVVSFLIISGYVITKLISVEFSSKSDIKLFYLDRSLRLFPQFIFYMFATTCLYLFFDATSKVNAAQFLVNFTMIPLNMFAVYFNEYIIFPQSWSLGLEMQFYLLIPLILLTNRKVLIASISLILFIPAYLGIINTDYFGYRMITGTLFIFLLGSMMASNEIKPLAVFYSISLILFLFSLNHNALSHDFNKEVISGIIIGVPVVWLLFKVNIKSLSDRLAGDLSYGFYLNYLMFFYFYNKMGFDVISVSGTLLILGSSLIMSYFSLLFIERFFYKARHNKIKNHSISGNKFRIKLSSIIYKV